MDHKHSILAFWYHDGCPRCKLRQLTYGYRLDPAGREEELESIKWGREFTASERKWILEQATRGNI